MAKPTAPTDGSYQNPRCYAACLGGCSEKISLEHVTTRGIFGDALSIEIKDPRWPDGKRIGIKSAGANILCEEHNSKLSVLDDEIIKLASACASFWDKPTASTVAINGNRIGRWFLKFIAGLAAMGQVDGEPMVPTQWSARQLFGLDKLEDQFSLYGLQGAQVTRNYNRSFSCRFFSRGPNVAAEAALFIVNALPLLSFVGNGDPHELLPVLGCNELKVDMRHARVTKRPSGISLKAASSDELLKILLDYALP